MTSDQIVASFREKVCGNIGLLQEGIGRYLVDHPFMYDDGDCLEIALRERDGHWELTDEETPYMRLTYDIDEAALRRGTRQKIIAKALAMFRVEDRDGELVLPVPEDRFGDALFSFIQAILKITDVSYLNRERVRSAFREDLRTLLTDIVPGDKLIPGWNHKEHDPRGHYSADYLIEHPARPVVVFGLLGDAGTRDATISLLHYEKWELGVRSLVVFENQEAIGGRVLARLTDVADRQYSSLAGNKDRIRRHLAGAHVASGAAPPPPNLP